MDNDLLALSVFGLAGLISGFCSSAPLGPINLWIVESIIKRHSISMFWFIAGVVSIDMIFAAAAIWGYYEYVKDSQYLGLAQGFAGLFLIGLGIWSLLSLRKGKKSKVDLHADIHGGKIKHFLFGVTLCGSNPGFLMFWIFVIGFLNDAFELDFTLLGNCLFVLGVMVGDGIWFRLLVKIARKGLNLAKPSILLSIRYGIALAFLCFGSVTIWRAIH